MVVKNELTKLGLKYSSVELGEADIEEDLSPARREQFREELLKYGLELMDDRKSVLIQKIKTIIIDLVHYSEEPMAINLSDYLSQKLNYDYTYLANLFSEVKGTTIEHFIIALWFPWIWEYKEENIFKWF